MNADAANLGGAARDVFAGGTRAIRMGLAAWAIGTATLSIGAIVDREQLFFSYLIAYAYGSAILGHHGPDRPVAPFQWDWSLQAFWQWAMSLGKPLGIGLVALALTLAVLGYFITELAWRAYLIRAWRRRAARRRSGEGRP